MPCVKQFDVYILIYLPPVLYMCDVDFSSSFDIFSVNLRAQLARRRLYQVHVLHRMSKCVV